MRIFNLIFSIKTDQFLILLAVRPPHSLLILIKKHYLCKLLQMQKEMKLQLIISNQTNPHLNVAVENYLLNEPLTRTVTLYLWKNYRTVVVGRNQNPFAECDVALLLQDGGYVMRRSTGGGAVYHDSGNVNFSFIASHDEYDVIKQFSVLQQAVAAYGLHAEISGRNDVLCDGRKFSGNAFNKGKFQHLHHGTILIDGNINDLQRYLKVKPSKLQKHGVQSVRSRVVNLAELAPVTAENIIPNMISAFENIYQQKADIIDFDILTRLPAVNELYRQYSSDEWIWDKWKNFKAQKTAVFSWGEIELSMDVDEQNGIIRQVTIASDSLQPDAIAYAQTLLTKASIHHAPVRKEDVKYPEIINDILSLVY